MKNWETGMIAEWKGNHKSSGCGGTIDYKGKKEFAEYLAKKCSYVKVRYRKDGNPIVFFKNPIGDK
jgi:hypothetical protein